MVVLRLNLICLLIRVFYKFCSIILIKKFAFRYFVVEINPEYKSSDDSLELKGGSLHNAITDAVQKLHGDFGVAAIRAGLVTKYCNEKTRIAIIRTRHGPHRLVASALPFITKVSTFGSKYLT